jgi:hypothetical protein
VQSSYFLTCPYKNWRREEQEPFEYLNDTASGSNAEVAGEEESGCWEGDWERPEAQGYLYRTDFLAGVHQAQLLIYNLTGTSKYFSHV